MFGFLSNLTLFIIKLYVGLSCNSISIYSDGINNMFDGLSVLLTALCLGFFGKSLLIGTSAAVRKTEELLSLILSTLVFISGIYFAYTSLERLIYPTPIWFSMKYLYLLMGTALFKLIMFLVYRRANRRLDSQVVKIMSVDCILDFFITAVTIISLFVSARGSFSLDAFCGLFISTVIIISAVKGLFDFIRRVIGYVPAEKRERLGEILSEGGIDLSRTDVFFAYESEVTGYISFENSHEREKAELLYGRIKEETEITLKTVIKQKGEN
ncbi:MAG: cation transporter [Clostridia bacterium]|nr:cation transporter [Clostridia bacterium]